MKSDKLLNLLIDNNKSVNANIDSIYVSMERDFSCCKFRQFDLHELRSASKLVVAFAYGCALNNETGGGIS